MLLSHHCWRPSPSPGATTRAATPVPSPPPAISACVQQALTHGQFVPPAPTFHERQLAVRPSGLPPLPHRASTKVQGLCGAHCAAGRTCVELSPCRVVPQRAGHRKLSLITSSGIWVQDCMRYLVAHILVVTGSR